MVKHHPLVRGENNSLGCHSYRQRHNTNLLHRHIVSMYVINGRPVCFLDLQFHCSELTHQSDHTHCLPDTPRQSGISAFVHRLLTWLAYSLIDAVHSWPTEMPPHLFRHVYSTHNRSIDRTRNKQSTFILRGGTYCRGAWRLFVFFFYLDEKMKQRVTVNSACVVCTYRLAWLHHSQPMCENYTMMATKLPCIAPLCLHSPWRILSCGSRWDETVM